VVRERTNDTREESGIDVMTLAFVDRVAFAKIKLEDAIDKLRRAGLTAFEIYIVLQSLATTLENIKPRNNHA